MKKRRFKLLISLTIIILLGNMASGYINMFNTYLYQTENAEFEFTTMPSKGRDIGMMERQFSYFKENNPGYNDLKLFRTFKRNPLKFWNWYKYLTDNMYRYEYHPKVNSISGKGKFGI